MGRLRSSGGPEVVSSQFSRRLAFPIEVAAWIRSDLERGPAGNADIPINVIARPTASHTGLTMVWFFLHLAGAVCWLLFMVGVLVPEPWFVKLAFFFLAMNAVFGAMKSLVSE